MSQTTATVAEAGPDQLDQVRREFKRFQQMAERIAENRGTAASTYDVPPWLYYTILVLGQRIREMERNRC